MDDLYESASLVARLRAIRAAAPQSLMDRVERSAVTRTSSWSEGLARFGAVAFVLAAVTALTWAGFGHRAAPTPQFGTGADTGLAGRSPGATGLSWIRFVGQSMEPTLHDGQMVPVDRSAYLQADPSQGDIVLIHRTDGTFLVKRVIAVPGDRIQIADAIVSVNGVALTEPYLGRGWTSARTWNDGVTEAVPPDQYFVLGDNRDHSTDSRFFGFVARGTIEGRLLVPSQPSPRP